MQLWNRAKRRRIGGRSVRPGFEVCEPRLALAAGGVLPTLVDGTMGGQLVNYVDFLVRVHSEPVAVGDVTFYVARTNALTGGGETTGIELWRTDGTPEGTALVKDISPGSADARPEELTSFKGQLFFTASNEDSGRELWKTDGTAAGTQLVRDIYPGGEYTIGGAGFNGPYSSSPYALTVVNDTLFFFVEETATSGVSLWKSDGTTAGTVRVKDLQPAATGEGRMSVDPFALRGALVFSYSVGGTSELWASDGTTAGTGRIKTIGEPFDFEHAAVVGNQVFFAVETPENDHRELWRSDGTASGTRPVLRGDGTPLRTTGLAGAAMGGRLYVSAFDQATGYELWRTDGTPAGTVLVKDIAPGPTTGTYPLDWNTGVVAVGNRVFFGGYDAQRGVELWKSDGTAAGTVIVKDVYPGKSNGVGYYANTAVVNDRLYFVGRTDDTWGDEGITSQNSLWTTDGTTVGTVPIDIPANVQSRPIGLWPTNGSLWMDVEPLGGTGFEDWSLWRLSPPTASSDVNGDGRSDVILRDPDSGQVTAQIRNLDGSLRETRVLGTEAANRVANGGFESVAAPAGWFTTYGTGSSIGGWRVTSGTVQVKGKGFWQSGTGVQSLDLNGDGTGAIAQDVSTTVGESYDLSFRLAGNPDGGPALKTVDVTWGPTGGPAVAVGRSTFSTTGRARTDMGWIDVSLLGLKATGTKMTLGFVSQTGGAFGPGLDGIVLRQAGAADWTFVAATDMTGDGVAELVWRQGSTGTCVVWVMNAFNTRVSARILGGDKRLALESTGDFDGDGRQDLIWRDVASEQHWLWRMRSAQPTSRTSLGIRAGLRIVPVDPSFDANGDGTSDILWRNLASGATTLWRMNGATLLSASVVGGAANGVVVGAADYDGDGKGDVLWRRPADGRVTQWLMNDGRVRTATVIGGTLDTTVISGGDFNGDGMGDTVWRIASTGTATTRLLSGKTILATWAASPDPGKAVVRRPGLQTV